MNSPKPRFQRYIGIDYSGAQTASSHLPGLRVYIAAGGDLPVEVNPLGGLRKYWTREGIADFLAHELSRRIPTAVGIDHGFSFPIQYFETHQLPHDWPHFLEDFNQHWPTDEPHTCVDLIRDGICGNAGARSGNSRWRRITETRCRAKSVFHFDVPGSVAKSTHSGIPWLRYLRNRLGDSIHFWPFDGWEPSIGKSLIAEVYPSLWKDNYPRADRTPDQHDAYVVAASLQKLDTDGALPRYLNPTLSPLESLIAQIEGWILGIPA